MRRYLTALAFLLLLTGSFTPSISGQQVVTGRGAPPAPATGRHDMSPLLTTLPQLPPRAAGAVLRRKLLPNRVGAADIPGDGAPQFDAGTSPAAPIGGANFEGINNRNLVLPPDTTGDIGPNHYVQMVNLSLAIWDRSGNLLYGPANANTLWQGFGGPCETTNNGDPIVLYDHLADRWMLSQFALPAYPSGPFYQCIAVSQSGNPLGAYHRYEFKISDTKLNDYPKLGVWHDGYYMAVNQYTCWLWCTYAGQGVVSFERDRMLNGQSARMIYFDLAAVDLNLGGMLPADLDGPPAPAGAPAPFCVIDDDAWAYSPDQIQCWNFHSDWTNPAASTFTLEGAHVTAPFDSNMCAYDRHCVPQRETTAKVDAISDRLMYRLQYRNFGTHETLVTNHTVDATGFDGAGIRWYELRKSGTPNWSIHQQGTYAPADGHHRWMASAAMNGAGDLALGFSISSDTMFPSIRATGRLQFDPNGLMTQPELTIVNGTGHQTHSSGRWGDYSHLAVDPTDDCTFWYTQEYYGTKSSSSWQTRIGAFKLANCGAADAPPTVSIIAPVEGASVDGSIPIQITASDTEDAAGSLNVQWTIDNGAWTPAAYDNGSGRYVSSWDTSLTSNGSHTLNVRATDTGGHTATDSNAVVVNNVVQPPVETFLHIGDLDRASSNQKNNWTATVTVAAHDANHAALAGASVSGTWSSGGTGSCTTDSTGRCTISRASLPRKTASVTFTVTIVTSSAFTYAPGSNHDPDADSNGTTVTVLKP